ncbi:sugar transferase [Calorimonas adulescens]|uniref:Sugar transferase n=1 Tax=Calorimonas adulescens TaxID=2606906 RepID=A0A5D8QGU8_9THEO|nr:sugar transferase [Calorimonas adulescens]MDI6602221.1 sugar transferase [Thermoanaerobacteraceae bacterium]TZE83076.1 sugar transferase [Calorimonas adulescens]
MSISFISLLFDIISIILSFILSLYLRFDLRLNLIDREWYIATLVIILTLDILILYFKGMYDNKLMSFFNKCGIILDGIVYSTFVYIMFSYLIKNTYFSRLTLFYFVVFSIVFQMLDKVIVSYIQTSRYKTGKDLSNVLMVGKPDEKILGILHRLSDNKEVGINIIGYISNESGAVNGYDKIGDMLDAESIIKKHNIKAVFIASKVDDINEIINICLNKYIKVYMINDGFDILNLPSEIEIIDDIALTKVKDIYISGAEGKLKRIMDIVLSLIAIVILSPLFLIIAIIIKLDSPGPVFFTQNRIGLNGTTFKAYKFRSMVLNAEEILMEWLEKNPAIRDEYLKNHKLKDDPRITRVGKFLRKTSLDELPQIFNVLKGEMSLVGPRPYLEREIPDCGSYIKYLWRVPPGITGLWQISGRSDVDFEGRLKMDMQYIMNWSIWLDINILFKTIPAVLKKDGAY